jgi:hypothetical protein
VSSKAVTGGAINVLEFFCIFTKKKGEAFIETKLGPFFLLLLRELGLGPFSLNIGMLSGCGPHQA